MLQTVTVMAPTNADNPDLTFVVTPTLPAGLRYGPPMKDAVSGAYELGGWIIGTPREATPQRQYTLTVGGRAGERSGVTIRVGGGSGAASAAGAGTDGPAADVRG